MKVYGFITLYEPDISVRENIMSVYHQVDHLFLCDNSHQKCEDLINIDEIPNCTYIFNNCNLGLSSAFNAVFKNKDILFQDDDFIIFFDQDSRITEGHIDSLLNSYRELKRDAYRVASLGPVFYDKSINRVMSPRIKQRITAGCYIVSSSITSSLLMEYVNLKRVNFWNDDIFLDMADWDLCWRLKAEGMINAITDKVILEHQLGIGVIKKMGVSIRKGSPIREYYQTRDGLKLLFKNYTPIKYRLRILAIITIRPFIHMFFLDKGLLRLKYVITGIYDFLCQKSGELKK